MLVQNSRPVQPIVLALAFAAVTTVAALVVVTRARAAAERRAREAADALRLLRAVIDAAPFATVLLGDVGQVKLTNARAREMFAEGAELEGQNFLQLLAKAPSAFREALVGEEDALFSVGPEEDGETFRLTKRHVEIDQKACTLLTVETITRAIRRQEVEVWKKLLRTISHELNNSLAPISSLVHSARLIVDKPAQSGKLARVFDTIDDRTKHLTEFLEGYVRFARLPKPRPARVAWAELLGRLGEMFPSIAIAIAEAPSTLAWFDAAQVEQVVINLLKNAEEAGGPKDGIELAVSVRGDGGSEIVVRDRGPGMSKEVLASALLPFYSTKERGTGLGLALCREIVEAHGGKIRVQNRDGGGLEVTCSLPGRETTAAPTARITLTHG